MSLLVNGSGSGFGASPSGLWTPIDTSVPDRSVAAYAALLAADGATDLWMLTEAVGATMPNSISDRHGTVVGNPTHTTDAPFGDAGSLMFDGNDYLNMGDPNEFSPTSLTLECWAKCLNPAVPGGQLTLFCKDNATTAQEYYNGLSIANEGVYTAIIKNTSQTNFRRWFTNEGWIDGRWHHFVATYDGVNGRLHLWVDGEERDANPNNGGTRAGNTSAPLTLGARGNNTLWWNGPIFGAAFYPSVLSGDQIRAHYEFGRHSYPDSIADPTEIDGLIAWHRAESIPPIADEATFTSWPDDSGSGNPAAGGGSLAMYRTAGGPTGGPSVQFNGTGSGLALRLIDGKTINITNSSTFVVYKPSSVTGNHWVIASRDDGTSNDRWYVPYMQGTQATYYQGGTANIVHQGLNTTDWHLSSLTARGFRLRARTNATQTVNYLNSSIADPITSNGRIGIVTTSSSEAFEGLMVEIVHYNRALADEEAQLVEDYLANKYGLTI